MLFSEERASAPTPFLASSGFTPPWGRLEKLSFLSSWLGQEFLGASWPGTVIWGLSHRKWFQLGFTSQWPSGKECCRDVNQWK